MNERIKVKVKQILDRGAKGLLRFRMAFLFSLFLIFPFPVFQSRTSKIKYAAPVTAIAFMSILSHLNLYHTKPGSKRYQI